MSIRQFSRQFSNLVVASPRSDRWVLFDRWFAGPENPTLSHQAVLRLTYGIIPVVVLMSLVTYLLGIAMPVWIVAVAGAVLLGATWRQEGLLARGVFTVWMPLIHLNLALLMMSVWVAYSGGLAGPFVWMYAVPIAIYGVLFGSRWAVGSAALCTAYLLAILAVMRAGLGTPMVGAPAPAGARIFLISYIGMFFIVAIFSGVLRRQARVVLELAHTDPLTGLANRRALRPALDREVSRALRYGQPCAVLVLELDRFKQINDRFGHLAGDDALRRVAVVLTASCRATDVVARFGGDEFVIVMPSTSAAAADRVGRRICSDIEEQTLLRGIPLTLSAGLAECPRHGDNPQQIIDAADRAMYAVKRRGGNGIEHAAIPASPTTFKR
jgi:diguanylate cyclase (GGDEF)-like protein